MNYLRYFILVIFISVQLACGPNDEKNVELVPEAANQIRLISSGGIYPHTAFRSALLNGDYAYLAGRSWGVGEGVGGEGLFVYSLANLDGVTTRNIQESRIVPIGHQAVTLAMAGNTLYVGGEGNITVLDVSDPAAPVEIRKLGYYGDFSLKVYNNILYALGSGSTTSLTIETFDLTDPQSPLHLQQKINMGLDATVAGAYLYSGLGGYTSEIRARNLSDNQLISITTLPGLPYHFEIVQGNLIVLTNNSTTNKSSLLMYSLANPSVPALLDSKEYNFEMRSFSSDGQNLVVSGPDLGEIIQIVNQQLIVANSIDSGSATTVDGYPYFSAIEQGRALIAGDDYALYHRF